MTAHPEKNDQGEVVTIRHPSSPTPLENWHAPWSIAVVTPGGPMPPELNGVPLDDWSDVPATLHGWANVGGQINLNEAPLIIPPGLKTSAGVIIKELDGRFWVVHPTNAYGDYKATFPKGTIEDGLSLQASAIKEAYEECGLKVEITGLFADVRRSTSIARYYTAKRVGGNPASMGWESQAVALVPKEQLGNFLTNKYDHPLLLAIQKGS